jgi:hypothetical protein
MSDSMSPDNLGYAFFSAYRTHAWDDSRESIIKEWLTFSDEDKSRWIQCSNDFCRYLKKAEADS